MIAGSLENIIDKVILIRKPEKIDFLVAMFYRNLWFFIGITLIGLTGFMGKLSFVFTFPFLILAVIYPLTSFAYDYFLRNNELSRFSGIFYTFPLFFLCFDNLFFHLTFSIFRAASVLLLVAGAILFSINPNERRSSFSRMGWFWMLIYAGGNIYLYIIFKVVSPAINGVSFYFSTWAMSMVLYALLLIATKKYKKLKETATTDNFFLKTLVSKSLDSFSGVFYLQAISLASLTVVSAFDSLSPLVMLMMLLLISLLLRIHTAEDFSKKTLALKVGATLLLVLGSLGMALL